MYKKQKHREIKYNDRSKRIIAILNIMDINKGKVVILNIMDRSERKKWN